MPKQKIKNRKIEWVKVINRRGSFPFQVAVGRGFRDYMPSFAPSLKYNWYNGLTYGIYFPKKDFLKLGRVIEKNIRKDPKFAEESVKLFQNICESLLKEAHEISNKDLKKLTEGELAESLARLQKRFLRFMPFLVIPHAIEFSLLGEIKEKLKEGLAKIGEKKEEIYNEYLELLTLPVKMVSSERNDALKIAAYVRSNGWNTKAQELLTKHTRAYCWLPLWVIDNKPLSRKYFKEEVENLLKKIKDPLKEIEESRKRKQEKERRVKQILRKLKADRYFRHVVQVLQEYIFLRTYGQNSICKTHYYYLPLLYEIASRMGISKKEAKYLTYEEILHWLKREISARILKRRAQNRIKNGWAVLMWKGNIKIIIGARNIMEAIERYNIVTPLSQKQIIVRGNSACKGKVEGEVKVVRRLSEMRKVKKGNILVTKMTTPDYTVAIGRCAAIVTDEGGVTCHAAIISREQNIPCIIGTKNATLVLSDGDWVEVDANIGTVRVLKPIKIDKKLKILNGQTAYKGKAKGFVRLVFDANDFSKVEEGDILVAPGVTPEYLSSLYKCRGLIVDEECITSHAMLYAQALKMPAIIGTRFATRVLKNGDLVEVNAEKGIVRILKREK